MKENLTALHKKQIKQIRQFVNWSTNPKSEIKALYSYEILQKEVKGIIRTFVKFADGNGKLHTRLLRKYYTNTQEKLRQYIEFEGDMFVMH